MVILKALTLIRPPSAKITCLHIDYANRPESAKEADFLISWVELIRKGYPQIPQTEVSNNIRNCELLIRRIDEVTRGVTDRMEYEKVSRNIRYGMYREALALSGGGVMLGHHMDDLRENVVSNVMRLAYLICKQINKKTKLAVRYATDVTSNLHIILIVQNPMI